MDLPSFMWLWRIAAWSMGLSITAYFVLAISGIMIRKSRQEKKQRPKWLRPFHWITGSIMVSLVMILLSIGLVGTISEHGSLGHSIHLPAGILVVTLVGFSAWSSTQISASRPWARQLHVNINIGLFLAFCFVGLSGLKVVQQYIH